MILVVCLDDALGMAFNNRRQSRDRLLTADLAAEASGAPIYMDPRSAILFEGSSANTVAGDGFSEKAGDGDYCFVEFFAPYSLEAKAEKLIIYRWNRRYQADVSFNIDLSPWTLESSSEFPGSSHENITKGVYIRE